MKAVVMVGGKGTRLRPLTCIIPKPMVPLLNRPMMEHVVGLLRKHDIDDLLVTLCYLPEAIENHFGDGLQFGVSMSYYREEKPLGTAGSVKSVARHLDGTFVVTAGDVLTDIDLSSAVDFHRRAGAMATLVLTRVSNPLEYGVVMTDKDGRITRFLEKPSWGEVFSDTVNTCIYVLEPDCLGYFERDVAFDFSKDLFPLMLANRDPLFGYVAEGYWSDIGNLDQYRQSHYDALNGRLCLEIPGMKVADGIWVGEGCDIHPDAVLEAPVIVGADCVIGAKTTIGQFSVIDDRTTIREDVSVKRSIVWESAQIGDGAQLRGTIICNKCTVRERASLYEGSVLGAGSSLGADSVVKQAARIWPGKTIDELVTVNDSVVWAERSSRRLFGSCGVSGLINVDLTPEFASKVASAYGADVVRSGRVCISNDPSAAARMLKRAMVAGLMSAGIHALDLGALTTAISRYATRTLDVSGGIHVRLDRQVLGNAVIEFFDSAGINIDKGTERKIENAYYSEDFGRAGVDRLGELSYLPQLVERYLQHLLSHINVRTIQERRIKVVISTEPGCLSLVLPAMLNRLGCEVIATDPEGTDMTRAIGHQVVKERASLGVSVGENGDTLSLVDETGHTLTEMELYSLVTLVQLRLSKDNTIAVPVSAPNAVDEIAHRTGAKVDRTSSSIRTQIEKALVHLDPEAPNPIYDSIVTLARIIEYFAEAKVKLSEVVSELPVSHMDRQTVPCSWEAKGRVMRTLIEEYAEDEGIPQLIEGVKVGKGSNWSYILPDPDKPLCHVYSEALSDEDANSLSMAYADRISQLQVRADECL